jgi:hypothetical protein
MSMLGTISEWVEKRRRGSMPQEPPSWRANILWLLVSLITTWISGKVFLSPKTMGLLWSSNVTLVLNGPNFSDFRLPAFSTVLFLGAVFLWSIPLLAPHYLLYTTGSWLRFLKAIGWYVAGVTLGPILGAFIGGLLSGLLTAFGSLFGASIPKLMEVVEKIQFGFLITLPWAPPDKPFTAQPNLGCLLAMLAWLLLIVHRREIS